MFNFFRSGLSTSKKSAKASTETDSVYFSNLSNAVIIEMKSAGNNGTSYKVTYKNGKVALLKKPKSKLADNLMYEYIVGKEFINRIEKSKEESKVFIETYAIFKSISCQNSFEGSLTNLKDLELIDVAGVYSPTIMAKLLKICECNETFLLLVEYKDVDKSVDGNISGTLKQYIRRNVDLINSGNKDKDTFERNLMEIFGLIYTSLVSLYPKFVHNDLSIENVLIVENKPYIIDYGRCYFEADKISSETIYNLVRSICLEEDEDGENDGLNSGFGDIWKLRKRNGVRIFMNKKCSVNSSPTILPLNTQETSTSPGQVSTIATSGNDSEVCVSCRNGVDLLLLDHIKALLSDLKYDYTDSTERKSLKSLLDEINPHVVISFDKLTTDCDFDNEGKLRNGSISSIHQALAAINSFTSPSTEGGKIRRKKSVRRRRRRRSKKSLSV